MKVDLLVHMSIEFCDEDLGDPAAGDPLNSRMRESVLEAVTEALVHAENRGYSHDMETLTSLGVLSVELVPAKEGV